MTHVVGRGFHTFWNPNPSKSFTLAVANSVTPKARIGIGKGSITKLSRACSVEKTFHVVLMS